MVKAVAALNEGTPIDVVALPIYSLLFLIEHRSILLYIEQLFAAACCKEYFIGKSRVEPTCFATICYDDTFKIELSYGAYGSTLVAVLPLRIYKSKVQMTDPNR